MSQMHRLHRLPLPVLNVNVIGDIEVEDILRFGLGLVVLTKSHANPATMCKLCNISNMMRVRSLLYLFCQYHL